MANQASPSDPLPRLVAHALALPEARADVACKGTPIEARTVTVRKKAFVFFGKNDLRLRLRESVERARALAAGEMPRLEVGKFGWVKLPYSDPSEIPVDLLERWIEESYRVLAPKSLVNRLDT